MADLPKISKLPYYAEPQHIPRPARQTDVEAPRSTVRGILTRPLPSWITASLLMVAAVGWLRLNIITLDRGPVRKSLCVSNQKHIGIALLEYTEDNDGKFPDGTSWMTAAQPYWKSTGIFHCPDTNGDGPGYAFNSSISGFRQRTMPDAAGTVMTFDSDRRTVNAADPVFSLPRPGRHSGGKDVVDFADGHARALTPDTIPAGRP